MAEPVDRRAIQEALDCIRAKLAHQQEHPQLFAEFLDLLAVASIHALSLARGGDQEIGFEEVEKLLASQALINKMLSKLLINSQYEKVSELVFVSSDDVRLCMSIADVLKGVLAIRREDLDAMSRRLNAADPH